MAYSQQHLYLTVHWGYSGNAERGQFGLRFGRTTMPDETTLEGAATFMKTWWSTPSTQIPTAYRMDMIKVAMVQPDGHYPDLFEPWIKDYSPIVAGGASGGAGYPLQACAVTTLDTAAPRGRASRGRIFLPPITGVLSDFKFDPTYVTARANQSALLVSGLNDVFGAPALVMSRIGAGVSREITQVRVGNYPDVQRRRARQIDETYTPAAVV